MKKVILTSIALILLGTLSWIYGIKPTVTIQTANKKKILVNKEIALEVPFIHNAIKWQKDNPKPINLFDYSSSIIKLIFSILADIHSITDIKRQDGEYIAQRIQPTIDSALKNKSIETINTLIAACNFLELPALVNGAIRVVTQKMIDYDSSFDYRDILQAYTTQFGPLPEDYEALYEKQYRLIKDGNIPELSVADYIAINGKPELIITTDPKKNRIPVLDMSHKNLTSLDGLRNINKSGLVKELLLSNNHITELPVGVFSSFPQVQWLDVTSNRLSALPEKAFRGLPHLTELYLPNNQLTKLPMGIFNEIPQLQTLSLSGNQLISLDPEIFNALTQLKGLALAHNKLTSLPRDIFNTLTQLELLYLNGNKLTAIPKGIFNMLTSLEELYIYNNPLDITKQRIQDENPGLKPNIKIAI